MTRGHVEIVRTADGHHLRIRGGNGEPIVWSENHPDVDDALNALRVVAEQFNPAPALPVRVTREWVTVSVDGDEHGEKYAIPVRLIDERTETCPGCGSEQPSAVHADDCGEVQP